MSYVSRLISIVIVAVTLGFLPACSSRANESYSPASYWWNMSDHDFSALITEATSAASSGQWSVLWDLVQIGRLEDGARSEEIGEGIAKISEKWGPDKFSAVVRKYPSFAQTLIVEYLRVARGDISASGAIQKTKN